MNNMENNNNMMSHGNSESGSASNSPVQYTISPPQPVRISHIYRLFCSFHIPLLLSS